MNRKKEYILITAINVFFAVYTSDCLGHMPYISLIEIYSVTYLAMFGWFMYGSGICFVLRWEKLAKEGWIRSIITSIGIGILIITIKAVFDYISGQFSGEDWSQIKIASIAGILTDIFGIFLTVVLFLVFVKGKRQWSKQAKKPAKWILTDVIIYILGICWVSSERGVMLRILGESEENFWKADYYYAHKFLAPLNVWSYTFLMIMLWWLMRSLYVEENGDGTRGNETSSNA